jgi:hypothetical protein
MKRIFYGFTVLCSIILFTNSVTHAQSFTCVIDGKNYTGKVTEAVQVTIGKEAFLQIKIQQGDKGVFLYLKVDKMKGALPAKLAYTPHNYETGQSPDAEIIWVPDGPENPQWNAIEGKTEITQFDPAAKTVSGTFEFVVEKMVYGTETKKETLDIKEGKFSGIAYIIEPPAKK